MENENILEKLPKVLENNDISCVNIGDEKENFFNLFKEDEKWMVTFKNYGSRSMESKYDDLNAAVEFLIYCVSDSFEKEEKILDEMNIKTSKKR